MTSKLEKRELEEPDKLTLLFMQLRTLIETHRTRIYMGVAIVAFLFVAAGGVYFYQTNYEKKASDLYNAAFRSQMESHSPETDDATVKSLKDLILAYPRSDAAVLGHYRLGNIYLAKKDYDAAKASFQKFIELASSDNDLVTLAYNGLGTCEEQKKDFKKALDYYELAMKSKTSALFEALNYANTARVYEEMKDNKKAVEFYEKALSKTTDPLKSILLKRKISSLS